jgi:branched-chain amino acid aminotransferase
MLGTSVAGMRANESKRGKMADFETTEWIWHDGEVIPWADATLHVMSHVIHYGSSVFEGIRCYRTPRGPAIFRLKEHMRRFDDSRRIYRMDSPYTGEIVAEACRDLVRLNGLDECYLRPIAFRGYGAPGMNPTFLPVETYIITWPWGVYLGKGALTEGVDVCVSSWQRPEPNTYPAIAKAGGNYLNGQLMKMEAQANGFAEAIGLGPGGLVSEGSGQNVCVVRDGALITPAVDGTFLQGITRDAVLTLARDIGIPVREESVPREMLYVADEAFFAGTAVEITPIRSVDHIKVGTGKPGPITRALQERLMGVVHGEIPDTHGWLAYVNETAAPVVHERPSKVAV